MRFIFLIFFTLILASCGGLTRPMEKPVIERSFVARDHATMGMLALTPERRLVLQNFDTKKFCAEAPTETGINISSAFEALAKMDLPAQERAEASLKLAQASQNQILNPRSQGMQLFLANSYFICQMYMNSSMDEKNALTPEQYLKYQTMVLNAVAPLIEAEIPYLHGKKRIKPSQNSNAEVPETPAEAVPPESAGDAGLESFDQKKPTTGFQAIPDDCVANIFHTEKPSSCKKP